MSTFKQVHMKFWQNDFVLGLTAEERYFYIYLITNSMTTQCGIYKFNRRLAELETGYTAVKIEEYLKRFQDYGKIVVSQTSTEIMLVNWFKHNFKSNKKTILAINKELRDLKDKTLLIDLYAYCSNRQYPAADIFNGVTVPGVEIEKQSIQEEALPEIAVEKQEDTSTDSQTPEAKVSEASAAASKGSQIPQVPGEIDSGTFLGFKKSNNKQIKHKARKEKPIEELVLEECSEEEAKEVKEGTTVVSWGFAEEDRAEVMEGVVILGNLGPLG